MSYNPNVEVDVSSHEHHHHGHGHQGHSHAADVSFHTVPTNSLLWVRRLSIVVVILSLFQIAITAFHIARNINIVLNITGLVLGVLFFFFGLIYHFWAKKTKQDAKTGPGKQKELLQPAEREERIARRRFILGALLAIASITLGVNYLIQRDYNLDVNLAQQSSNETWTWGTAYTTLHIEQVYRYSYPILAGLQIAFGLFFTFASCTCFRCLKFGNQAITRLIFVAIFLACIEGLKLLFLSVYAQGYDVYPELESHYPQWVLRSLIAISIAVVALSFITYLVNHRGWRVGFVLVGLLFIISTLFLVSLVGPSLSHTRKIYQYYNGTSSDSSEDIAWERLRLVDEKTIVSWSCPAKYVDASNCALADQVTRWESYPITTSTELRTEGSAASTTLMLEQRVLQSSATTVSQLYCLNTACEGVNGQLYAFVYLLVSNSALLTLLFSTLIVIGTAYFWYVNWIDRARKTSNDYCYALWMAIFTVAAIVVLIVVNFPYIPEETTNGTHQ